MPPIALDDPGVRIVQEGNSLTIGDSVKIVVSGQSPTRVKVSRAASPDGKTDQIR